MGEVIHIEPLAHSAAAVAERIHAVQMLAYRQEASWVGALHFPPLDRTLEDVRLAQEHFVGALVGTELIGAAAIAIEDETKASISSLVVAPKWQRRGVAKKLLHYLIEHHESRQLQVQTAARNWPARMLYRSCGFAEVRSWFVGPESLELVALRRPAAATHNVA